MQQVASNQPIVWLCEAFGVHRSQFYAAQRAKQGRRARENACLTTHIKQIFQRNRGCYGSPRITQRLQDQGIHCGHNRVARIMRQEGLRVTPQRKFVPVTTDSRHGRPIAPNRLPELNVRQTDQVWTADITYLRLKAGWGYLAVVMDLFSRKIVGWALEDHLRAALPAEALRKAIKTRRPGKGLIHHSDQGTQYASLQYQKLLARAGITQSMSRRGNCYDNAHTESLIGTIKSEIPNLADRTIDQARTILFEYVEVFYNRQRLHSSLGYVSPDEFERQQIRLSGVQEIG